jgi:Flp pilus assembly pilin Flp
MLKKNKLKIMKKTLITFLIIPFIGFSQIQIGQDINGENIDDRFGSSVALSEDGNIVAVSAQRYDGSGNNLGHVKIYENIGGTWTQIGQDIEGEADGDSSGTSIALSENGNIVAIGAHNNDANGAASGHVRVYENIGGTWTQIGQDIDGDEQYNGAGWSVSLSSDGSILAIGAPWSAFSFIYPGNVKVYENINSTWTQIGQTVEGDNNGDRFGESVVLSDNGDVFATYISDGVGSPPNRFVRVFENINDTWIQIGQDVSVVDGNSSNSCLALSGNGNIFAIGEPWANSATGHVTAYENISGTWTQVGQQITGEASGDFSGNNIAISDDGGIIVISSTSNDGNGVDSGSVRVFINDNGTWNQLGLDIDGENTNDQFGQSVAISANGTKVAIGTGLNDGNGIDSGHVRVYGMSALLSTEENEYLDLKIYPNPAKTFVNIAFINTDLLKNINVYNSIGQLILNTKKSNVNISKLDSGIYYIEIIDKNNNKVNSKLIIE